MALYLTEINDERDDFMVAKRVCAGLAAIAMVFTNTSIPMITSNSNVVITANAVTASFTGLGEGTESNPYQITSASELMEISNNPGSFYVLNNDIDLSDFNGGVWNGIGDENNPFTGVFDGQNHTISNLNFDRINIGLFNATCGCSIKNLVLKTSSINISYSGGTVYDSENDYYDYDESLDTYSSKAGGYYVGSLIGIDFMSDQSANTVIDNCFVNADLNIKSTCRRSKTHYVGGLIGCVKGYEKELNLTNCTMEGKVSFYSVPTYSGSENYIGGFVGSINASIICNDVTVLSDISSSVNATAINTYAGGISGSAGYFESSNCTINGDIVADCTDESFISDSSHWSYSGGLSGKASDYSVYNSHVKGKIYNNSDYGTGHAGGLFGQCNSGDIISCSYNGDISNYCTIEYSDAYAGGLCGEAVDITIDNFKTNNTIYNRGYYRGDIYTGGIVGKCSDFSINNYEVTTKLTPCAYDGAGASSYAGGLVGYASDVYLEETPVDVSIDNSSKGIHNYNSEELNNDYVGYAYNYSNSTPENSKAELSFTDVNSIIGESEWFFGNYTAQFASKIDSELSSIDLSYDESAMEITDVNYSKSGKKSAVISGTINAKKPGNHEVSVSLANSSIDVQTFLVNIEPELVLPGSTVGNMYNHYACMTVNCDGAEDVVTKDVTFNVSIDDANAEYLESFLNSIEVSTLETGDLTAHATYKTSYTIADDGKSAEFVVTVSCVNTDMTDYISVKTPAQEKVLQITRDGEDHTKPLAISVFGDTSVQVDTWSDYPTEFSISASVENIDSIIKNNAYVKIELPKVMTLSKDSKNELNYTQLLPNDVKEIAWNISVPYDVTLDTYPIRIICGADNIEEKEIVRYIKLNGTVVQDNRIDWGYDNGTGKFPGIDNFNFSNSSDNFTSSAWQWFGIIPYIEAQDYYHVSDEYFEELTKDMTPNVVQNIVKARQHEWGGSCYGMAAVISLMKAGYLTPSYWQSGASKTHDLNKPKDNSKVEDLINFYYLSQYLPDVQDYLYEYYATDTSNKAKTLEQLVKVASQVKHGGLPVSVGIPSHEIVAYDVVNETNHFNNREYNYKVSIWDPNYKDHWQYLYITEDFSDWYYKKHTYNSNDNIDYVFSELALLDVRNPETKTDRATMYNYNRNFIKYYKNDSLKITSSKGTSAEFNNGEVSGDLETKLIASHGETADGALPNEYTIYIPDGDSDIYTLTPDNNSLDATITFESNMFGINATGVEAATYDPAGTISVELNDSNYVIDATSNNGYGDMPWFTITASGNNANEASLRVTENGAILNSDNLKDVKVTANNIDEAVNLEFSTEATSVLLDNIDDDTLGVFVDNDNNGTYETIIADSDNTDYSAPNDDNSSSKDNSSSSNSSETDSRTPNDSSSSDNNSSSDTSSTSSDSSNSSSSNISDSSSSNTSSNNNSGSNTSQSNNQTNSVIKNTGDTSNPNTGDVGTATKAFGLAALMLGIITVLKKKKQ